MEDNIKKIVVLGAGESGVGAARLAQAQGYKVFVSDAGEIASAFEAELKQYEIEYEMGQHTEVRVLEADEVVKSPGIPNEVPILEALRERNIPIISEIEFASRCTDAKIIAITGSNGKTTTTLLTYHLMQSAGFKVGLAGNIGDSFARKILEEQPDYWVLEVSSFQLEHCFHFSPDIAILLNITPDHLDRYNNNFQRYVEAKFRIVQNLKADQHFIYFKDNPAIAREMRKLNLPGQLWPISIQETLENGAFLRDKALHFLLKKNKFQAQIPGEEIPLKGRHNLVNTMAAVLAGLQVGATVEVLRTYFHNFKGVEHRLEEVAEIAGVKFINDSKATNVDSVYYALDSFEERIVWIAGGVDKGNDYEKIFDLVKQKVKYMVCLGRDNQKIFNTFKDDIHIIYQADNMRDAVEQAFELARAGDIVLLSPACASFDLFKNYEDRGQQFKKIVAKLNKIATLKGK
ncbi:MAG: UDP-N-acetylmuramoyl-L-alanine--D-glutamate ligase [Microscillaceae bacterium]